MRKLLTLTIVKRDHQILLGLKKRGFGVGRWNGFGGKVEERETIYAAAIRELYEESGIVAEKLEKVGILEFNFESSPQTLEVHIFCVTEFNNDPEETEEMRPQWFDIAEIPYNSMWSDDIYWLPYFLEGKKFKGSFLFDRPSDADYQAKILSYELSEIQNV